MPAENSLFSKADDVGRRLAILSFLLFSLTSSRFAFPDESAALLAQHLDLTPFRPLSHPIWGWIVQALTALRAGPAALLPNLFSALCGAGCVWLIFQLTRRMTMPKSFERHAAPARVIAPVAAALVLMVAPPIWMVSNRAHPGSFDLLLLLGAIHLLLKFRDSGNPKLKSAIPCLLALGAAESATLAGCFPLFFAYWLMLLRARRLLNLRALGRMALMMAPGAIMYLITAWSYFRAPVSDWREFDGFGQTLWYVLLDQWQSIKGCVPRQGWLLLFFSSFLPWLCCVWFPKEGSGENSRKFGLLTLMAVIFGLGAANLFNARFSPWRLTGSTPLLVAPYALISAYLGYATGFWFGHFAEAFALRHPPQRFPASLFLSGVVLVCVVAGVRNYSTTNARGVADLNRLAREMVKHAEGRPILLTEGLLDSNLLLAARDLRVPLDVPNMRAGGSLPIRRYIASLTDSPRLRGLAEVGLQPFLVQWMKSDTNVTRRLAFQASPDLWLATGYGVEPGGSLYLGRSASDGHDVDGLVKRNTEFRRIAIRSLKRIKRGAPPMRRLGDAAARHLSSVANDLGVFLENNGRPGDAIDAYDFAIRVAPKNLSAHLNLQEALLSSGDAAEAQRVSTTTEALALEQRIPMKTLVDSFGHVRTKAALERLRKLWDREALRAEPLPLSLQDAIDAAARGDTAAAREKLEKIVRETPRIERAWILLATIAHETHDSATFSRCLQRMRNEEKEWPQVMVMAGETAFLRQDMTAARTYFERALALWPQDIKALELLVRLELAAKRFEAMSGRLDALLTYDPGNVVGNYGLGVLLYKRGELGLAEEAYRNALARQRYPAAMNNLAWLLQMRGDLAEALELAREATQLDPTSYNAWDTLGVVQGKTGALDEAESSLKMACAINPRLPDARVHLLQLQASRGQRDEAESGARDFLSAYPDLSGDLRAALRALAK